MAALAAEATVLANAPGDAAVDGLLELPLEELLTVESTSVAKKRQKVSESAAAVFVISQEDIRRSAASTIADLLRMVPGMEVADIQQSNIVVSARGFNSMFSNTIVVMIDGRPIYISSISGILWDMTLMPLSDIERIEVVRGPGTTLWGNNAVNGVINIISRHSSDRQGAIADARLSGRKQQASISYADQTGEAFSYRLYATGMADRGYVDNKGKDVANAAHHVAIGGRVDYEPDGDNTYTFQSEVNKGNSSFAINVQRADPFNPGYDRVAMRNEFNSFYVLGRWTHRAGADLDWSLQANFDHFVRTEIGPRVKNDTANLDFGARWRASTHHELNIGLTGRLSHDNVQGSPFLYFDKPIETDRWISGYVQDDISIVPNRLRLTVGSKFEYNNFTGFEAQPSAKLFYRISPALAVWGGASRAVLTPSRIERHGQAMLSLNNAGNDQSLSYMDKTTYVRLEGARQPKSERLDALELGMRAQLGSNWSLDVSAYANHYDRLFTMEPVGFEPIYVPFVPFPVGSIIISNVANNGQLDSRGVEALLTGRLTPFWKVDFTYSEIHFSNVLPAARVPIISNVGAIQIDTINVQPDVQSGGAKLWIFPDYSPKRQFGFRNMLDVGDKFSLDTHLRYVASLVNGRVPDYVSLDARLSYRPTETFEVSMIGQNLLTKKRQEYLHPLIAVPDAYTPRVISMQARVRF